MSWLTGPMPWILDCLNDIPTACSMHLENKRVFVGFVTYLCLPKFPAPGCRSSFWLKSVQMWIGFSFMSKKNPMIGVL